MNKNNRILWMELLRIFACLGVIVLHCASKYMELFISDETWRVAIFFHGITRYAVPIFMMISGTLFFYKDEFDQKHLIKRTLRMLYLYIVWTLIYSTIGCVITYKNVDVSYIIENAILCPQYHLWYLLTFTSVLIIAPIMYNAIKSINGIQIIKYYLVIFLLTIITNQIVEISYYFSFHKLIVEISNKIPASAVFKWMGFFVLGYYLFITDFFDKKKRRVLLYFAGIISICLVIWLTYKGNMLLQGITPLYDNYSLAQLLFTVAIFVAFKYAFSKKNSIEKYRKIIIYISSKTLGVYLVHVFFVDYGGVYFLNSSAFFRVIQIRPLTVFVLFSVCASIVSFMAAVVLYRIPIIKKSFSL